MSPPRDVGVAIAMRQRPQHAQEFSEQRQEREKHKKNVGRPARHHHKWWYDLICGLSLYLLCIYLPVLYQISISLYLRMWIPLVSFMTKILGDDAAFSDLGIIFILSISLAALRVALVQKLVDIQSTRNVEAIVRCKSIHLLSSAYSKSLSPSTPKKIKNINQFSGGPALPSLDSSIRGRENHGTALAKYPKMKHSKSMLESFQGNSIHESESDGTGLLKSPRMKRSDSWLESTWETVRLAGEPLLEEDKRLHSATRYATAIFRCLYISVSLATAWFGFVKADFWPPAVGGSGMTNNCWDLKGSPGIEEDFDELNGLLKFYYLLQASYHLHSGAFHVMTLVLLWTREYKEETKRTNEKRKPFIAYWRSLFQHGLALMLIGGSYFLASTRRLGAIGSFSLDASSLLLHMLQVCINSPHAIPLNVIKFLHRGLVIPVFIYCRFFIWPFVVWPSAFFESRDWLKQMESTMFPGIYHAMIWVFTLLTAVLLALNAVLLKRLINHPHLQRVYRKKQKEQQ